MNIGICSRFRSLSIQEQIYYKQFWTIKVANRFVFYHLKNKKFDAIITDKKGNKKVIPFGAEGYSDFILSGGDKKTQQKDIDRAIEFWGQYKSEKYD